MAEDNLEKTSPEENENMKKQNGNGNGTDPEPVKSQTEEAVEAYIEDPIKGLIKQGISEETVACLAYKGKRKAHHYKICMLVKSRRFHDEYFGIKNTISTSLLKEAELIDINVDKYLEKSQAISDALNNSLDAIKAAKSKLWEIREAACKLDAARNDSCNSEQLSAMSKIPAGDPDDESGIVRFHSLVDGLVSDANALYDAADDTFEKGVKVAGIQAYMNIASLKELSTSLKESASAFNDDVDQNLTDALKHIEEVQLAFTEGLQGLDQSLFDKNSSHLTHLAMEAMQTYAEELPDQECTDQTDALETICEDIKEVFQSQINCEGNGS